jgi:DNA polymerase-3 subunit beta
VIVPGKTMSEINKILPGDSKDDVDLYITERHILFEFGQTRVVSRLLEGKFYNISHMLSSDYETKITVNKMELIRCLDRSTLFIKEADRKPIVLKIEENSMIMGIASEIGSMKDQISLTKEGKNLNIGFNPRFLVDALRAIDEETISIYFINDVAPCIIRDEKNSYLYLILPIAIPRN